jgi:Na+-translocating ferredoxin:NAD+ oxidoreductase subunit B
MGTAVLAVILVAGIGVTLGVIIGIAAKAFAVETDPRIEEVNDMLPGANCGGCGYAGCADFAKMVVAGEVTPDACPVCSADDISNIAKSLGIEAGDKEKTVAVVLCGGNDLLAKKAAKYNGISDCKSAVLVSGGAKGCSAGCLGYASCARACPFGAIEMREELALVHNELCVGCEKCVETCPRNLIKMVPLSAEVHVFCSSKEKGAAKKKVCDVPCIGCRKCVKASEEGQMLIDGFLIQTNYENAPGEELIEAAACPTHCLKTSKGLIQSQKEVKKKEEAA